MSLNQRISPSLSENLYLQQVSVRTQAGFTLIEAMVVVAILGILTSIALPAFQEWREHSAVNAATMAVYAKLKQARTTAVSDRRTVTVVFDTANSDVVYDDNNAGVCAHCRHERLDLAQFSPQVVLTSNRGSTTFQSNGIAGSNGTLKIKTGSYFKCITVNIIGRAYIQDAENLSASCNGI